MIQYQYDLIFHLCLPPLGHQWSEWKAPWAWRSQSHQALQLGPILVSIRNEIPLCFPVGVQPPFEHGEGRVSACQCLEVHSNYSWHRRWRLFHSGRCMWLVQFQRMTYCESTSVKSEHIWRINVHSAMEHLVHMWQYMDHLTVSSSRSDGSLASASYT